MHLKKHFYCYNLLTCSYEFIGKNTRKPPNNKLESEETNNDKSDKRNDKDKRKTWRRTIAPLPFLSDAPG